jgi:hypothetical protein
MGEWSSTIHQGCQLSINWTNGYGDLNLNAPLGTTSVRAEQRLGFEFSARPRSRTGRHWEPGI